ncbi:MAG: signal peptide peptidase SppA [Bacteroidaceae bacterium]|nr:signal peptide peptidase SppA [Bacteroidaceae bacterium]
MKDFLKYTFASALGLIIVCVILTIVSVVTLVGMASMNTATVPVVDNSVMIIKLQGEITERSQDNPFDELFGGSIDGSISMEDLASALDYAKAEDNIKGIYLEAGSLSGATPAHLEEFRNLLLDFKESGKFIVAYGDTYTQGTYYICSVADSLLINPEGMINWVGMASQVLYYKDVMDKVGVKMQVFKVGTYKSAVEPYMLNEMSDANREQIEVFQGEIWSKFCKDISKSRKISTETLNMAADSAYMIKPADEFLKIKMVDRLAYSDEVPDVIARMMKVDEPDDYSTITMKEIATNAQSAPKEGIDEEIAVYYADGEIVQEEDNSLSFSTEPMIVGEKVIKDLKALADDDDVKAVVLRVNSPGGSAYASEQIWHQVMNIKAKKPIIVSMGGYAASGGYYISCAADMIFAEPTTLTGSIGIFGMFPEASELLENKIGVHSYIVKTNKYGDLGNYFRAMDEEEKGTIQAYINRGYELFTRRCADGRGLSQDSIKAIGEGRVWTGVHAKRIGLVDKIGSLDDAIAEAKKRAGIEKCSVISYPAPVNILDQLFEQVSGDSYADAKMKQAFGDYYDMFADITRMAKEPTIQTAMPYRLRFNF